MNNYITYGCHLADGDMKMDSGQSKAVHLTSDAYDGGEPVKRIVGTLEDRKASTARGEPSWTPVLVREILRNKNCLGVEPCPRIIEEEQFEWVQKCLKRSRDLWNQCHPSGSIQGIFMHTGHLICSSCGGAYSIYKQSVRGDRRDIRHWKCRHYDPTTKEPCRMPILIGKQLDELFSQALVRVKTESALYHEEMKKILTGIIKGRQCMESELNGDWNKCSGGYKRMEQLYFQITARRYREVEMTELTYQIENYLRGLDGSIKTEKIDSSIFKIIKRVGVQPDRNSRSQLINNAIVLQYPEAKTTKDKKSENIRYCVPFGYWLDAQEMLIIHE